MTSHVSKLILIGAAIGASLLAVGGLAATCYAKLRRRTVDDRPPKRWRRVATVTDILCYPIKSCGPVRLPSTSCPILGVDGDGSGGVQRDRCFMIVSPEGQFVTARVHPRLVLIAPRFDGTCLWLTAPDMPSECCIDVAELWRQHEAGETGEAAVWQQPVPAIDCGDAAAEWLSRFVCGDEVGVRLVFYPEQRSVRPVRERNRKFATLHERDSGALHDVSSFMLLNEASLADLNGRMGAIDVAAVPALQFRPNFVVAGAPAFAEDTWRWVRVGEADGGVVFRNIKPCLRCIFTNIDPMTAQRNRRQEPLRTLRAYRSIVPDDAPGMGVHLGVRDGGADGANRVRVGDAVYVEEEADDGV